MGEVVNLAAAASAPRAQGIISFVEERARRSQGPPLTQPHNKYTATATSFVGVVCCTNRREVHEVKSDTHLIDDRESGSGDPWRTSAPGGGTARESGDAGATGGGRIHHHHHRRHHRPRA